VTGDAGGLERRGWMLSTFVVKKQMKLLHGCCVLSECRAEV
jgi:hypothetical protein